jgi:Holliday junction resolvasome RuvABC DNA-binding subunit
MNVESTVSRLVVGNAAVKAKPRPGVPMDAFVKHLDTAKIKPINLNRAAGPVRLQPSDTKPRPVDRVGYAEQHVKASMKQLETNIAKALHRLGFDRGEIKRITHQVMDPVIDRVKVAVDKLGDAKHPIPSAHHIVDKAVDTVGNRLARTLHGLGFDRRVIAKVVYHVTNGLDRA